MKRICYLSRGGLVNGSQRQLFYLVAGLDRRRYTPVVICRGDGLFVDELRGIGVEAHVIPLRSWRSLPARLARGLCTRRLTRRVADCSPNLIHCSDVWMNGYLLHVAGKLGVPSALSFRTPMSHGDILKHRCTEADAVVAISPRAGRQLLAAGMPEGKLHVVYDSVDLERFHPRLAALRMLRTNFPHARGPLLGMVGRLSEDKKQMRFLHAAARLIRAGAGEVTFLVIGEHSGREYDGRLRQFLHENGLSGRVIFTGRREDMPEVLADLDVLVTLSGGSVMMEAMACGTAVVSTGFTRPEESTIVRHGVTGFVPADDDELHETLLRLISDGELRHRLGRAGRQRAEQLFGHKEMVGATQRVYEKLLER